MIPEHMRYRPPEWWLARYQQYGLAYSRWRTDTRFLIVPEPRPLPWLERKMISRALGRRAQERQMGTR